MNPYLAHKLAFENWNIPKVKVVIVKPTFVQPPQSTINILAR